MLLLTCVASWLTPISDADATPQPVGDAQATVETAPVANAGDAADDPAIWRDPVDPSRSIVIGNDKMGALEVYDMSGALIQRFTGGFFGNVDTRTAMSTGVGLVDIAVTYRQGIRIFGIDPVSRQLTNITDNAAGSIPSPIGGEGICLYRAAGSGQMFVFVNARDGRVAQFGLDDSDADGLVEGTVIRQWDVGAEVEGCVADDLLGRLYISEETQAIWRYGAGPSDPTDAGSRVAVDRPIAAGGHFRPDAEGLTIVYTADGGGYLIASSQAASDTLNSYLVFDRLGGNAFIREFRVVDGPTVDGCGRTDGIDALSADLGPGFREGVFICQDNNNTLPGSVGNQNFKFVPLERVVGLPDGGPPPTPDTVVMVVSSPAALISGETAVRDRLTNAGYTVSIVDDNAVTAADASGAAFVFVSSSVNDATVGTKLRPVPQPVWMAKPYSFDNMLMTGTLANVDYGTISTQTIEITDPSHPLAAGNSGSVSVTPTNKTKSWGVPGSGAEVVATAGGRVTTFVYQAGDQLVGGVTAPGCRLSFPAFQNGPTSFTSAAWAMFDATAAYAASNCEETPSDPLPTVSLTAPADGATVNGAVALSADASDNEGVARVEFFVSGNSVGVDTDSIDGWGVTWDSTTSADGAATVRATVTDTADQTSDDQIGVTIDNLGPTIDLTAPTNGATVSGPVVNVNATATDAVGLTQVEFSVDGTSIGVDQNGGNGWSATWDSTAHAGGPATVTATATDTAGRTASDSHTVTVDDSSPGAVLMVVADPNIMVAGEGAVLNRLANNLGFSVAVIDDNLVAAADANGAAFVFVSSTVNGGAVGTKIRTVTQAVWVAKPYLLDDMLMTGTVADVDYGSVSSASVVITNNAHPLSAGLSGAVTVTMSNHTKSVGVPGATADVVATAGGKTTTFAYQAGDPLVGGSTAPGCRLTSSAFQNGPANFTASGWAMFEAAALYAASGCGG